MHSNKKFVLSAFPAALLLAYGTAALFHGTGTETSEAVVTKVIDGDTLLIEGGKTVRLRGEVEEYNNTPEIVIRSPAQLRLLE